MLCPAPYITLPVSVPMMTNKYSNEYKGYNFYTVFSCEFDSSSDVLSFFPITGQESGHIVPIRVCSGRGRPRERLKYSDVAWTTSPFIQQGGNFARLYGVFMIHGEFINGFGGSIFAPGNIDKNERKGEN